MRRFRYICGGEEGKDARGSEREEVREVKVGGGEVMTPEEGIRGTTLSGGGAPLTSWSSFDSDMATAGPRA
jgi:hypothetical protein